MSSDSALVFLILSLISVISLHGVSAIENAEADARKFIHEFEEKYWTQAEFVQNFLMIDLKNLSNGDIQSGDLATFNIRNFTLELVHKLKTLPIENFQDAELKRQISKIMKLKDWLLDDIDLAKKISFQPFINKIAKRPGICSYENRTKCDLSYEPHVRDIIIKTNDPKELEFYWIAWRDHLDNFASIPFEDYVKIVRKSSSLNGFNTTSKFWYDDYENDKILEEMESLILQMQPFYKQLHTYLRYILRKRYGTNIVSSKGPIPEHLLEKIWLEGIENFQFYEDFDNNKSFPNLAKTMTDQNYTALKLVEDSDQFYQSLGLPVLTSTFWSNNSLPLPESKNTLICRPIVYDFGRVAGLKYCPNVDFRAFLEDHAIMAKVQFHEYTKDLPYGLNVEACPGLWKIIGKSVKLSASSIKHLREIDLFPNYVQDEDMEMNSLLRMAVHTVFKLPMYFVYEKFFANILDGKVEPDDYNCVYWRLQESLAGIEAPTQRDDDNFDVSKQFFKVTQSSLPLATKLISEFLGFHLYKVLCEKTNQYNANNAELFLKECDFCKSIEAGKMLSGIMSLGWKKPCFDVIELFTKQRNLTANAMLEYFQPLHQWLERKNKMNNEFIGWNPSNKCQKEA